MDGSGSSALLRQSPPFPPPSSPSSDESSALYYIVAFLALIIIPTSIYLFFFLLKCRPIPSRRFRRRSDAFPADLSGTSGGHGNTYDAGVSSVFKYLKETHAIDIGSECPVCLSAFGEGEEVRQLMSCKHSFHGPCIDLWLHSHSSCPICRVSVPLRASKV